MSSAGLSNIGSFVLRSLWRLPTQLNDRFSQYSPLTIVCATLVCAVALQRLKQLSQALNSDGVRESLGHWALRIPTIRRKFESEMKLELEKFRAKARQKWEKFGKPITEIPQDGLPNEKLLEAMQLAQQPFYKVSGKLTMGLGWQRTPFK